MVILIFINPFIYFRLMEQKISVISVVHNEEKLIRRCLESVKDIADEILILHDGPCSDNTLKIAREYTDKVFATKKNVGVPGPILPILFRKVKGPWIFKLDADEFLSAELKKNIRKLIKNPEVDAYIFRWPFWNGKKYITKNCPTKISLYRKSKMSYFGFPHWDEPKINVKIIRTNYQLEHRPILKEPIFSWKTFVNRGLKRYGRLQAEYTIKDFKEFDSFQYNKKDFTWPIKIRRKYPLLSAGPMAILAFFRMISFNNAWKEGKPVFIEAFQTGLYYLWLGWYIYKLKLKQKN